jgi:eukaryotic-like serine/threonine-protein kinase
MPLPQPSDANVGGYRLVRKLGAGSRADAYLAAGITGTVVLKVFHPQVDYDSVGRELDALGRLDSPHCVRLLDVSSAGGELPTLILERVQRGSVAALMRDRACLERGEVVTLLAPLASVVNELHQSGVAHGGIGASSVHLGGSGEPVLLGFGHCELFAAGASVAALDAEPAAVRDREALAAFACSMLACVRDGSTHDRVHDLVRWIEQAPRVYEFPGQLESRLFDFADAMPIAAGPMPSSPLESGTLESGHLAPGSFASGNLAARRQDTTGGVAARVRQASVPIEPALQAAGTSVPEAPSALSGWLQLALLQNPLATIRQRVVTAVRGVRKPLWLVVGGVALALVLAIALIPSSNAASEARPISAHSARVLATPQPLPTASALPDDPLLALPLLLGARATCFRDRSVLCLEQVDEPASGAFSSDAALIQQIQAGGEIPKSVLAAAATPTLLDRMGDSALVSLGPGSNPASALMIRDKAGWRIRDFLSGTPVSSTPP